jgi:hypothetical protein
LDANAGSCELQVFHRLASSHARRSKIYQQPEVQAGSPEILMLQFDKQTCGILSVKDGPTENPWRTLIWPLTTGIEKMRTDTALATTLVLAFSESWDQHISTGIEHLRGARILVN